MQNKHTSAASKIFLKGVRGLTFTVMTIDQMNNVNIVIV